MADCQIEGSTLTVRGDLMDEFAEGFRRATLELLEAPGDELVLDMAGVGYMRSYHVGILVALHADALEKGKSVKVFASPKVGELLALFDLDEVLDLEVVG